MKYLIEEEVVMGLIEKAIEDGELIVCERCGLLIPAEAMYGSVCHDCASDLIEDGLAREREQENLDRMFEEHLQDVQMAVFSALGVPVGAFDIDLF